MGLDIRHFLKVTIVLLIGFVWAQDNYKKTVENKEQTVMVRDHYDNGNLKEEGMKKADSKVGVWTYWKEDGKKYLTENYIEGKKDGIQNAVIFFLKSQIV